MSDVLELDLPISGPGPLKSIPAAIPAPQSRGADRMPAATAQDRRLALDELFERCYRRLFRLARRLADDPNDSEDLLQETFLRAARQGERLPEHPAQAEAWLIRTLVNLCRDRYRRRAVWRRLWSQLEHDAPREVDWQDAAVARRAVEAALGQLSPRRRAVVALCDLEELTSAEAAELLGMNEITLRWHLSKARRELAKVLLADHRPPMERP